MSAPSFSSFPPSFGSFPDPEGDSGPSTSRRDKEAQHKQDRPKGKDDRKDKRKHRDREPKHDKSRRASKPREEDVDEIRDQYREPQPSASSSRPTFYSDRKGDTLNIKYGGLHAGDVPRYRPVGRGKVLGLGDAWQVVDRSRTSAQVAPSGQGRHKAPALEDSRTKHLLKAAPKRSLISSTQDRYPYQEVDGFLRLPSKRKEGPEETYREITSKDFDDSDDSRPSSDNEAAGSSDSDGDTPHVPSLQSTLKELDSGLRENPSSIPNWLSLLFHTLTTISDDAKNASRMRAEISVSILSRALESHPSNKTSMALVLRYLVAGEALWTPDVLDDEWEKALRVDNIELWVEWFDWKVRTARSVQDLAPNFTRALSTCRRMEDETASLRLLWRVATAFRDAGFGERATALFQAQGELLYNMPTSLSSASFGDQLESLEAFWEAELPRLGEQDASGWAAWESSGRPEHDDSSSTQPDKPHLFSADPYSKWAQEESQADHAQDLPARATSDDDPYAVIFFSDIQPFLLDLKSKRSKEVFRLIWLSFAGLHIPGFAASLSRDAWDNGDDRWSSASLSSPGFIASVFPRDTSLRALLQDSEAGVLVGREQVYSSPFGPVKQWGYQALGPFDTAGHISWRTWTSEDVARVNQTLVGEIFRQCTIPGPDASWELLNLAFQVAVNVKHAIKISKALLAKEPNSLPHWAAHARLERSRGRFDDARKVYETVLGSAAAKSAGCSSMWWDWAEMEWLTQPSETAAVNVVLRSAGSSGSGGVAVLRAKRQLEDAFDNTSPAEWRDREAWIKLLALLELLTASPSAALATLDSALERLPLGSVPHESLLLTSLLILYLHGSVLRAPLPPSLLRERVERAMEVYPNNTVFLGLFLEAQKGQSIWGRVGALLGDYTLNAVMRPKDVTRRVADVWAAGWQTGRWKMEEERTRSGLSSAVQDVRTRCSPILWRFYLEFEIRAGNLQRAKKLFFRAVGECPLVKDLYLVAFGPLRSVFSPRELNELADTMAERGIRMRQGLDEVLVGWADPTAQRQAVGRDEDEVVEDEIEYNARELRRLRPY